MIPRRPGAGPVAGVLAAGAVWAAAWAPAFLDRLDAPGPQPEGIASDGERLWVADFVTGFIYAVDTGTGRVAGAYDSPGPHPEGLAWDGTHLWSADWETRKIYRHRVDEHALTVVREFRCPGNGTARPVGLAWDGEMLWLTAWFPPGLYRLDPETGEPVFHRALGSEPVYPSVVPNPEDLAWDGEALWITDWYTQEIHRIDPGTMELLTTIPSGGPRSVGLTFHKGYLWNGDTGNGSRTPSLYRLDVQGMTAVEELDWGTLKRRFRSPETSRSPPR